MLSSSVKFKMLVVLVSLQVWRQLFSPLHALNFGVGGDATQHVLWRLSNGELDNISPKVVIATKNRENMIMSVYLHSRRIVLKFMIKSTLQV